MRPGNLALFTAAAGTAAAFYINFCNLVFRCGCHSLWDGGVDFCNIHVAGVKHCPWCSYGYWGYLPFAAIVLVQAVVIFRGSPQPTCRWGLGPNDPFRGRPRSFGLRALLAFLAFPVTGGVFALLFGWLSGYWA